MSRDLVVPRLEELPEDTRRLLDVAREGVEVPAEVRSRLYASLLTSVPTGGGGSEGGDGGTAGDGGVGTPAGGLGAALSGLAQSKAGVGLVGAIVGAGLVLGGQQLSQPEDPASAVVSAAPAQLPPRPDDAIFAVPSASVASEPVASNAPPSASVASAGVRPAVTSAAPPPEALKDNQLRRERALIDAARMAVARRQGEAALNVLSQYASEFPRGELREEREGLMVHALALAGRKQEAEDQAARYKDEFPNGLMSDSMHTALEEPGPDR